MSASFFSHMLLLSSTISILLPSQNLFFSSATTKASSSICHFFHNHSTRSGLRPPSSSSSPPPYPPYPKSDSVGHSSCIVSSLSLAPNYSISHQQRSSPLHSISCCFPPNHTHFPASTITSTSAMAIPLDHATENGLLLNPHSIEDGLLQKMAYEGLVYSALHGLVIGDRYSQSSGSVPAVGLVHAPFAFLPTSFPESEWEKACEVAPIFNELVDRVVWMGSSCRSRSPGHSSEITSLSLKLYCFINSQSHLRIIN